MQRDIFKFFGALTFLAEAIILYVTYIGARRLNVGEAPYSTFVRFLIFFSIISATGVGLFYARRWAAVLFSIATSTWGVWMIIGTIAGVPFPLSLINFSMAAFALIPVIVTISSWRHLRPLCERYA
jgi:hypothetical protein